MDALVISGGKRLVGTVDVGGSKNAALAIMSAVVLADGVTTLTNVPLISDTITKARLLEVFGCRVKWEGSTLYVDSSELRQGEADEEMVRSIRTSFYLLGPIMARTGFVRIPAPGGCKIGARPVDFHLKGLSMMGADIDLAHGEYTMSAKELRGAEIYLDVPSAGATQHLMATATLATGNTIIQNAAFEPEVTALADFLNRMGAKVEGAGTSTITIQGVKSLNPCDFKVHTDRMQAGTYMLAGAMTGGDVTVRGVLPEHQSAVINKLRESGVDVEEGHDWIRVVADQRPHGIRVKTMPYPGFATDMQQPMAAMLTLAHGRSVVEETIYESRTGHVQELNRMGANITQEGRTSIIEGVERLQGANVVASDLRAGAALVLAGVAAEGETVVRNVHFIDRGYQDLEANLNGLGATVERVSFFEDNRMRVSEAAF